MFRWTLEETKIGPGGTGKCLRIGGFEEWRIGADGLIAESKGHLDAAAYRQQLEEGVDQPKQSPQVPVGLDRRFSDPYANVSILWAV